MTVGEFSDSQSPNTANLVTETLIPFSNTARPARARGLTQLLDLQETCYFRAMQLKTDHEDFAALARAFCLLEERIRIRRGIPLPGQLRPDLPPMKGLKGKRGKGSPVLDLPAAQAFSEAVEKVKAEARAAGAQLDTEDGESAAPEVNPPESKAPKKPAPKPSITRQKVKG
jgi:hypothetical protein